MKALLLGSGKPAAIALDALLHAEVEIVAVGAPEGEREQGLRGSLLEAAAGYGIENAALGPNLRLTTRWFVRDHKFDFGLTVGYRGILDKETRAKAKLGWFNIHSSLLPAYKGRAPINWAIINGETTIGATLHVIEETVDGGDVVSQESFELHPSDDVSDALGRYDWSYIQLVNRLVYGLRSGDVPRTPMPPGDNRMWPARTDADGEINWSNDPEKIVNLIRATAPPYPGAWTMVDGTKIRILKASLDPS